MTMTAGGIGVAGLLLAAVACNPVPGPAGPGGSASPVAGNGRCVQYLHPAMPASRGTQTPAGITLQMPNAIVASAATSRTLAAAYQQFNDMTCTQYSHAYLEQPPRFFYYDCVGFTGYTVRQADPNAWQSVRRVVGLRLPGSVPTPMHFESFFNGLLTTAQPGWQAVPTVQSIRAGDVLAWQPANADGTVNATAVGHSVMPLVTPREISGSNGTRWEVVVMDSTAGGHGPDDTRKPASPLSQRNVPIRTASGQVQASGLGIGTIALDTTAAGKVTGVEWNVGDKPESIAFGAGRALN